MQHLTEIILHASESQKDKNCVQESKNKVFRQLVSENQFFNDIRILNQIGVINARIFMISIEKLEKSSVVKKRFRRGDDACRVAIGSDSTS